MIATLGLCVYSKTSPAELNECIWSIWDGQTRKPDEIIIVKDGEISDQVSIIIDEFVKKLTVPVSVRKNVKNIGLTKNLNYMLKACNGKYFIRMDTDDIAEGSRFQKQIDFMESHKDIDVLGTNAQEIDENNNFLRIRKCPEFHESIIKMLPWFNSISHPTVMFRTEKIRRIGGYNENLITSQDYDLWFKANSKGLKFHNLQESLLKYRMNTDYIKRKNFNYRLNDLKIKWRGLNRGGYSIYHYLSLVIPILFWLTPRKFYKRLKEFDIRK